MKELSNSKITNISAYKRKKAMQQNKPWLIGLGILFIFFSALVYFENKVIESAKEPKANTALEHTLQNEAQSPSIVSRFI